MLTHLALSNQQLASLDSGRSARKRSPNPSVRTTFLDIQTLFTTIARHRHLNNPTGCRLVTSALFSFTKFMNLLFCLFSPRQTRHSPCQPRTGQATDRFDARVSTIDPVFFSVTLLGSPDLPKNFRLQRLSTSYATLAQTVVYFSHSHGYLNRLSISLRKHSSVGIPPLSGAEFLCLHVTQLNVSSPQVLSSLFFSARKSFQK